jgi:hypothetical protein
VTQPFGAARLVSVRPEDGIVVVALPFGTAFVAPSAVRPAQAAPLSAEAEAFAVVAADAAQVAAEAAQAHAAAAAVVAALPVPGAARKPVAPPPAPAVVAAAAAARPLLPFSSVRVVTQCVVQLELIGCVGVLADAHLDSLELVHVDSLLGLLQGSADFARRFNADRRLRKALWEAGFMRFAKHNKLPSLLRQETSATQQLLILLMRLYNHDAAVAAAASAAETAHKPWRQLAVHHLVSLIQGILFRYSQLSTDIERARVLVAPPYMQTALQYTAAGGSGAVYTAERDALLQGEHGRDVFREAAAFGPLVLQLLDGVLSWGDAQFRENLHWLYPLLTGLIGSGSVEIRQRLAEVFEIRLRKMLPIEVMVPAEPTLADGMPPEC